MADTESLTIGEGAPEAPYASVKTYFPDLEKFKCMIDARKHFGDILLCQLSGLLRVFMLAASP